MPTAQGIVSQSHITQFDSSCSDVSQCVTVHTLISYVLLPPRVGSSEIYKEGNKSIIVNTILAGKLISC